MKYPFRFPKGASIGVCSEYPTTVSSALTVWGLTCSQGTTLDVGMRDAWPVLHRKSWHGRSSLLGPLLSQHRDAIRRKAAPAHPLSSPIFRQRRKVDEKELTRSLDGSETLDQSSRLLFMRTAGNGGCSPGLIMPSFPSKQTRRGALKLIWDLSMLRYWWSRIIIRCPRRMWLRPKAVPLLS